MTLRCRVVLKPAHRDYESQWFTHSPTPCSMPLCWPLTINPSGSNWQMTYIEDFFSHWRDKHLTAYHSLKVEATRYPSAPGTEQAYSPQIAYSQEGKRRRFNYKWSFQLSCSLYFPGWRSEDRSMSPLGRKHWGCE